jgi:hypothetical protein
MNNFLDINFFGNNQLALATSPSTGQLKVGSLMRLIVG